MGYDFESQSDAFPTAAIVFTSIECFYIGVSVKHIVFYLH